MDKKDIENYIEKLKNIEKEISSEESEDISFVGELDILLSKLSNDITNTTLVEKKFNGLEVKIKKLHENAVIPTYSKDGDAGMDLTITSIISNTTFDITYGFGVAMEIPKNYVGLVFPRSSVRKYELSLSNCVGVIDSGYRGELQATFRKHNGLDSISYKIGDRGAQITILPYPQIKFVESEELTNTERGDGGFGSTGK